MFRPAAAGVDARSMTATKVDGQVPKRAIVTGSDSGIGQETAVLLAERGFDVGITWRADEDGARTTAERVQAAGRRAELAHLDLADPRTGAGVVAELAERLGGLGVLVNNAGGGTGGPILD